MKTLALGAALLALAGCTVENAGQIAQRVDVLCETMDGQAVRVPVDVLAAAAGQTGTVEIVREVRQAICAQSGLIAALAPVVVP